MATMAAVLKIFKSHLLETAKSEFKLDGRHWGVIPDSRSFKFFKPHLPNGSQIKQKVGGDTEF